ncbi:hypothetical protein BCR42DRAFT_472236 [Absidia repens]|uniref:Uncharacterized protein n=1 Tax=Absidia repens TaxID=90262 RepID=A0A1X2I1J9_9FUNG|nr:hypothetical protein BCR42DRAFT_472236 [Absidia repens]
MYAKKIYILKQMLFSFISDFLFILEHNHYWEAMTITRNTQRHCPSDQQLGSSFSDPPNKERVNSSSGSCSPREVRTNDIQCDSDDDEHGHSHFTCDDSKQIQWHAEKILQNQNEGSTIQIKPDDTAIITPHPRHMPNEILECIFNHVAQKSKRLPCLYGSQERDQRKDLYTCTLVNKLFYAIVNPLLWHEPVLDADPTHVQRLLDCLAATERPLGHDVRKLYLRNTTCTDHQLLCLMTHVRHLETLSIDNDKPLYDDDDPIAAAPITNTSLQQLPRYCSQLTSLDLYNMDLSTVTLRAIGQHCLRLTEFTLFFNVKPWDGVLSALTHCPLEKLRITCDDAQWGTLTEHMVTDIAKFQGLTYLCLSVFQHSRLIMTLFTNKRMKKTNKDTTTVPWPRLKTLSLDLCYDMDETSFIDFIKTHPHLQSITLEGAALTDVSLKAMAMYLHHLSDLTLYGVNSITSGGVRQLVQACHRLVFFQFYLCDPIVPSDILPAYENGTANFILYKTDLVKIRNAQGTEDIHWLAKRISAATAMPVV